MMRLQRLVLQRYRKARDLTIDIPALLVLIGPNASGKSNILDSLRFLGHAALTGDFSQPVVERGGFINLAWKGEDATQVSLQVAFTDDNAMSFTWRVSLQRQGSEFRVGEILERRTGSSPPTTLLRSEPGERWWWSETSERPEPLSIDPTACALSAASKNERFPGRRVYEHIKSWIFCDPNPGSLKQPCAPDRPSYLDIFGRNLAARLRTIVESDPSANEKIRQMVVDVTGVELDAIEVRELDDNRLALSIAEHGLRFRVNQPAISNGTLRVLALAVALATPEPPGLFAVEEPENYVHPAALEALVKYLTEASERTQVIATTHSPLLLDYLSHLPEVICVVSGGSGQGTTVVREPSREQIVKALNESGFSLGAFWLTRGFRGD